MDPDLSKEVVSSLNNVYERLLDLYKTDYAHYVEQCDIERENIKVLKPPAPVEYRPYPKITDQSFNEKLFMKKEFNRFKTEAEYNSELTFDDVANSKCSLVDFKLTNNQKFVKNFLSPLTPYNGLLLFHGVGVGKTCTAISIAEQYITDFLKPKRVLVILSSNIKDNFKKQIFDITRFDMQTGESSLCTGTKYPDMIIDKKNMTKDLLDKRVNKLIKERYQFVGYKELVGLTNKMMDFIVKNERNSEKHKQRFEEKLKEYFSDRLIIVDEAHNLRIPSENGKKQISQTLLQILQVAQNIKLVLLSATPMFNNAKEIVWMLNLLLTNDRRSISLKGLFDKKGELTESGKKTLIKASRGYVSYMRGENPFSFPFRLYPSINNDPNVITKYPSLDINKKEIAEDERIKFLELIGSNMSPLQRKIYDSIKKLAIQNDDDEDLDELDDDSSNDLQNTLQISNIVYPNISAETITQHYGKDGFNSCFDKTKDIKYKQSCLKDYGQILNYDNISKYSPKLKTVIDYIINSKGIVFIYSQYYYSGIYPLAIALEHIGFKKYRHEYNAKNLTTGITIDDKFDNKNRPSYIIISRDKTLSPNNDKEIADAKSRANKNGELIKVIIVSKVGTEGIDFKRIREVHILEPWFNLNRPEQIVGRAVRTCSHIELPKEERNVTIYMHANKYSEEEESVDIKTYRIAEKKQKNINEVQKILKQTAIDCNLNINTLLYPIDKLNMKIDIETSQGNKIKGYNVGDRDYSYLCDYSKCELKCIPYLNKKGVDETTFDPMFVVDDIDIYKKYISNIFLNMKENSFDEIVFLLKDNFKNIEEDIVAYALQEMVESQFKFKNSKGNVGYLIYKGNKYLFQDSKQYETKLTIEERNEVQYRKQLDFDMLQTKQIITDTEKEVPVKIKSPKKENIYKRLLEQYNALKNTVNSFKLNEQISNKLILESIADKLSSEDLKDVFLSYYNTKDRSQDPGIYDIIASSDFVIRDGKVPKYFYNYFEDVFYSISETSVKAIGPIERAKISNDIDKVFQKLEFKEDYKGLIEYNKKRNETTFNIKDNPRSKGFVCIQTSSLTVDKLKDKIHDYVPGLINDDKKHIKKNLCDVYELILRSKGNVFKRPFHRI
jgi:hypothetical protein